MYAISCIPTRLFGADVHTSPLNITQVMAQMAATLAQAQGASGTILEEVLKVELEALRFGWFGLDGLDGLDEGSKMGVP